ncbi:class II aldolase/adducin family protein [Diplocloster agilis]|uniref:class II aldolase/adducin family protein n=1 Tax=Diplocloster agilis TaxID=2850323 RepID=UPI0008210027|nr:class II aldolase/adducin family protein [Suonthocola fibrivorans]MCU6734394.1 class II aldolase/adducin family protein [Suonthocola fibrivorans]SCJ37532.1 L-fuculose phosphate aldolase [uncultured Clostridium sp.]
MDIKEISRLKEEMCEIGYRIQNNGFVAANDGNITVKIDEGQYLVTPTGASKGYMKPGMISIVNEEGEILDGLFKPSSEFKVHLCVYKHRPDARSVIHTHPPIATAYAVAGIPLDKYFLPEGICGIGSVPIVPYAIPGSQELADSMIPYLKDHNALLLENHGAVTVGNSLSEAYFKTETLEYSAKIMLLTSLIGRSHELPKEEIDKLLTRIREENPKLVHPGYRKYNSI